MSPEPAIVFTDYALMRIHQRDIVEEEIRTTLAAPSSRHRRRKDGRSEARQRFGRRVLLVIYIRDASGITVINAMWE